MRQALTFGFVVHGKPQQIQIRGPASCIVAAVFDSFLLGSRQPNAAVFVQDGGWRCRGVGTVARQCGGDRLPARGDQQ